MTDGTTDGTRLPLRSWTITALSRLRAAPASTALAATVIATAVLARAVPALNGAALAVSPAEPARLWSLLTHLVWASSPWAGVGYALVTLTIGAAVERKLGTRRFLRLGLVTAIVGAATLLLTYPVIASVDAQWGRALAAAHMGGPLTLVVGATAAYSAQLDVLWRRRLRTGLLALLVSLVAFGGGADDIAVLGAGLCGLVLGFVRWERRLPERSLVGIRQEARALIPLAIVAVILGTWLSAWATHPVGPASAARFTLGPFLLDQGTIRDLCSDPQAATECLRVLYFWRLHRLGPMALAALPLVLQLILAEGLRRGRRAAAIGTVALQLLTAALATAHLGAVTTMVRAGALASPLGLDSRGFPSARLLLPILLPLALALAVIVARRHFRVRCAPGMMRRFWLQLSAATAVILSLAVAVGWLIRDQFTPAATPWLLASDFAERLLPSLALALVTPNLFPQTPVAVLVSHAGPALVWGLACLLLWRVLRHRPQLHSSERQDLARLVKASGAGSLGWLNTWPGNEVWVSPDGTTGVAYRANAGVALTITQPAAPATHLREAVVGFAQFASDHSLAPAFYSVHEDVAEIARSLGWTVLQVAEEAVIELESLAFTGKRFQDIRTAMNHANKRGMSAVWTTYRGCSPGVRDQINAISAAWAADKELPEMGFTLGGIPEMDDDEVRLLLAVDTEGTVHAVTSWLPAYQDGAVAGLTLDVMRRRDGGFRPAIEFLIASAALATRDEGLRFLSLSGAPLARSGPAAETPDVLTGLDPILDSVGRALEPVYGFRSLLAFKTKFGPRFRPLYLALPDIAALPSVAVAISQAYLPGLGPRELAHITSKLVSHD